MSRLGNLKVGDVLRAPSGRLRIVRDVTNACVTFTIAHCSWTRRCVTVYPIHELEGLGYRKTGHRIRLKSKFDELIAADVSLADKQECNFTCCDVRGIP